MTSHSLCGSISGRFQPSRTRYANTFIGYQAERKRRLLILALDLGPLMAKAIFGESAKRTHSESLGRLA